MEHLPLIISTIASILMLLSIFYQYKLARSSRFDERFYEIRNHVSNILSKAWNWTMITLFLIGLIVSFQGYTSYPATFIIVLLFIVFAINPIVTIFSYLYYSRKL